MHERWSLPAFRKKIFPNKTQQHWEGRDRERRTSEEEHLHTFRLTLRGTAIVGWQWTQGWGHLFGNNSHLQLRIFSFCFILVRLCRGRKGKRDFSPPLPVRTARIVKSSYDQYAKPAVRHHCSIPWIDNKHIHLPNTDIWRTSCLTTGLQSKLWKQNSSTSQTTAWSFFVY